MIRTILFAACSSLAVAAFLSCENRVCEVEEYPPAEPRGLVSVTGDEAVYLYWYPNTEPDLAGYRVYSSFYEEGPYEEIGTTRSAYFVDYDVVNGETYFYAVTAYDYAGLESDLSSDLVFDTPRPEGFSVRLFDYHHYAYDSGYDFSQYAVQAFDAISTDILFDVDPVSYVPYIVVGNDNTDIQDFGYTESLDDIGYAPTEGWSLNGWVEAIAGHTYIVWTHDNHFAKFRISEWNTEYMFFDWAYQVDPGNRELRKEAHGVPAFKKKDRFSNKGGE